MELKRSFKNLLNFLLIGTTPIRLIEGITLNALIIVLSLSFIIYNITFMLPAISIICFFAFKHLRTCRLLYEIRIDELEVIGSKSLRFHRVVDLSIKILEFYLIGYGLLLILFFVLLTIGFNLFYFPIILTVFLYPFISIIGHFARVKAIEELRSINSLMSHN